MPRLATVAALAFVCAACDSGLEAADGLLLVSVLPADNGVTAGPLLALETEATYGCASGLAVASESSAGRLDVTVRGVTPDAVPCPAGFGSPAYAFVPLPEGTSGVAIHIRHDGSDDRYRYACAASGCSLAAISTRTTRPAAP